MTKIDYSRLPSKWSCIVIDGDPGAGKTKLGREMALKLNSKLISLDDYLACDGRPYLEQLNLGKLKTEIPADGSKFIVEGVCMLKALMKMRLHYDCLIFVKLYNGILGWELGEYLKPRIPPPHSSLRREIVEYYKEYKPFEVADQILETLH